MKQQANSSNDRPNQILTFSSATALDEVKARLPEPDTVMRVLCRARAQHRPKDPSSLQELTIPNHWSQTGPIQHSSFITITVMKLKDVLLLSAQKTTFIALPLVTPGV